MTASPGDLMGWLCGLVAEQVGAERPVDPDLPFADLGVSSVQAIALAGALRTRLDRPVARSALYDHPTVRRLARHLSGAPEEPVARETGPSTVEPVAIVGIGCLLPGGIDGPVAFWRALRDGVDAISEVPPGRWPDPQGPSRYGGFLRGDPESFDAAFFGISPREAAGIDPQQRLLLSTTWSALEDAGVRPSDLRGTATAVYIGVTTADYEVTRLGDDAALEGYTYTGLNHSIAANRISYVLDLHGPSVAINTACSSSLVAVHQAAAALRSGETTVALAGGVNVMLSPVVGACFTAAGVLSESGRSRTFSADADGYVRAEGATVVVLKTLSRAWADGDRVYAVIRGSAVTSDGHTNGLMAPNGTAQQRTYRMALAAAGTDPAEVSYVEAHGTGTRVGDLIELNGLSAVYGAGRDTPCRVGSVKSNIGHLEAAAGVTGLAKMALALWHRTRPASLHVTRPHPEVDWASAGLAVQTSTEAWPDEAPLGAVSSFGFGGTNAHAILAAVDPPAPPVAERGGRLLVLSARSPEALRGLAFAWQDYLADETLDLYAACRTAAVRRDHHDFRLAVPANDRGPLRAVLAKVEYAPATPRKPLVLAFPAALAPAAGSGEDSAAQGSDWLGDDEVFRRCDDILVAAVDFSPVKALAEAGSWAALDRPEHRSAMLVCVQVALAVRWQSWGFTPAAVIGAGAGEAAAAYVAGALTLQDALLVGWHLGRITTTGPAAVAEWVEACGDLESTVGCIPLWSATGEPVDSRRLGAGHWASRAVTDPAFPPDALLLDGADPLVELGRRYMEGATVDWAAVFPDEAGHQEIPTYRWDEQPHPLIGLHAAPPAVDLPPQRLIASLTPDDRPPTTFRRTWRGPADLVAFGHAAGHSGGPAPAQRSAQEAVLAACLDLADAWSPAPPGAGLHTAAMTWRPGPAAVWFAVHDRAGRLDLRAYGAGGELRLALDGLRRT